MKMGREGAEAYGGRRGGVGGGGLQRKGGGRRGLTEEGEEGIFLRGTEGTSGGGEETRKIKGPNTEINA